MDQIASPTEIVSRQSLAARIGWTFLILVTLYVCYFSHLNAIGFVGPDEPRYAWIARDMAESGDWITPRLYGKPWFEKPVLYYWSAAIFFKLSGASPTSSLPASTSAASPQSSASPEQHAPATPTILRISPETAARLPSAIYALLATLAVAWLALRLYGPETARWLLLLLPTTVAMIGFSHAAATDMPFSATLTIAMVVAAVLLGVSQPVGAGLAPPVAAPSPTSPTTTNQPRPNSSFSFISSSSFISFFFGLFLGLAVLAKGPVALILSGGAIFFWALFTKRWRDTLRLFHPIAIITFCATALPWYILCARRNPDFFRVFIIEHNFKRYLTPEFQHIQPFWYYLPIVLLALFPWIGMTISGIVYCFRKQFDMKLDNVSIYLLTWSFWVVLFFSTSHSKLPGYILPAIPAFGLLTAVATAKLFAQPKLPIPLGFTVLAFTPMTGIAVLLIAEIHQRHLFVNPLFLGLASILTIGCILACVILSFLRHWRLVVIFGVVCLVGFLELANLYELRWLDYLISPRLVAAQILKERIPAEKLTIYEIPRGNSYVLSFYLNKELEVWDKNQNLEAYILVDARANPCAQISQFMECTDLWEAQERMDHYHLFHLVPKKPTAQSSQ